MSKNIFYWSGINSDITNLTENCMMFNYCKICKIKQNLLNHLYTKQTLLKNQNDHS